MISSTEFSDNNLSDTTDSSDTDLSDIAGEELISLKSVYH